jgi:hypothetical protein
MVIGITLLKGDAASYYSPIFARGGQGAKFSVETFNITLSGFGITVQHKNVADTAWTTLVSFSSITAAGVTDADATSIKEQLRFKYDCTGTNAYDMVHFNMLAPAWRP